MKKKKVYERKRNQEKRKTRNNEKERRKVKRYIIKYLIPSQSDMDSNGLG